MKRALAIVLDSVGCGNAPDAGAYGDLGADTIGHLYQCLPGLRLPHLESLGLGKLLQLPGHSTPRAGFRANRLTAHAAGKDTTTGHWELMGHVLSTPFETYHSFPPDFVAELSSRGHTDFLGNHPASGTEIIASLGADHLETGCPILYTSADSVLQLAAHEERFGLDRLLALCQTTRDLLDEREMRVGRVIARPFVGDPSSGFQRTGNRHDFSLPPGETTLNRLQARGVETIGIGKISDIFAGSGITRSLPTRSNREGMEAIATVWNARPSRPTFILANLVDFDSLYGHRRDPEGYAQCLGEFDRWLGSFLDKIHPEDAFLITADHGNDPFHPGSDHTREQVPLIDQVAGNRVEPEVFSDAARLIESFFDYSPEPA